MTEEEKKEVLMKLGLSEQQAAWYLQYDDDFTAVVPTFRLLKPLNDQLEFYRGGYRRWLEKQQAAGTLEKHIPEAAQMLEAGVPAEVIEKLRMIWCWRLMSCCCISWMTKKARKLTMFFWTKFLTSAVTEGFARWMRTASRRGGTCLKCMEKYRFPICNSGKF